MKKTIITFILLATYFTNTATLFAQEPIKLNTETEDIALTDDLNIARAQVTKYPENPEAHFNLAIALSRTSLVEGAIKELRKTKKLIRKPENAEIIDKKINEYNLFLRNNPTANNVRYRLAFSHYLKAYLISKDLKKMEKEENLKTPKTKNSLSTKTNLLDKQSFLSIDKKYNNNPEIGKNLKLSIEYFKELLKLDPNDSWAKTYYAFILAEQLGEIDKARELWKEVLKQAPNNPAPYFFLGELHIKEGNLKEGLVEISEALLLRAAGN